MCGRFPPSVKLIPLNSGMDGAVNEQQHCSHIWRKVCSSSSLEGDSVVERGEVWPSVVCETSSSWTASPSSPLSRVIWPAVAANCCTSAAC